MASRGEGITPAKDDRVRISPVRLVEDKHHFHELYLETRPYLCTIFAKASLVTRRVAWILISMIACCSLKSHSKNETGNSWDRPTLFTEEVRSQHTPRQKTEYLPSTVISKLSNNFAKSSYWASDGDAKSIA